MKKNNKNKILSISILVFLALGISIGISYATINKTWFDASSSAPNNNLVPPINININSQVKDGSLSVGPLIAYNNAEFNMKTFLNGLIKGGTPAEPSDLYIGGVDRRDSDSSEYWVQTNVSGYTMTNDSLGTDELSSEKRHRLCSDDQGHIVFCPQYPPLDEGVYLVSATVDTHPIMGGTLDTTAECSVILNKPAESDVDVEIRYQANNNGNSINDTCSMSILKGATTATSDHDYGGGANVKITSYCIVNSTVPTNSVAPEC